MTPWERRRRERDCLVAGATFEAMLVELSELGWLCPPEDFDVDMAAEVLGTAAARAVKEALGYGDAYELDL